MPGDGRSRLEYPRLETLLLDLCSSPAGRSRIEGLRPFDRRDEAEGVLRLVAGLKHEHEIGNGLPPFEVSDLIPVLGRLRIPGSVLEPEELLAVGPLLRSIRGAKSVLDAAAARNPEVGALGEPLRPLPHLERALDETLEPGGTVKDSASPRLRALRRERERRREALRSRMERLASGLGSAEAAALVTLREGRYVLSVPQDHRGRIRGLVLDRSASGNTVYLEPMDVVDDNNALRESEAEERAEIRRILAALTDRLRGEREALDAGWEQIGRLDALRARTRLALRWAGEPIRFTEEEVRLRGARHPLLLEARNVAGRPREAFESVVPLDLDLDARTRILLITGPNMGGKTVTLKTLGFLSAAAQSGCLVPATPGSALPWVDRWLVSLGDEQSIDNDLSTFAAHLKRWGEALAEAGPGSLILLDELGSGTDPTEGAALAQSVLERLVASGGLGLVTTHLGSLKGFAAATEGVRNASMVFDAASRRPNYRLAVGVPGESHAIEMARQLGFPEERVARAEALLPEEERDYRALLGDLQAERRRLAEQELDLEERGARAEALETEYRQKLERLIEDRAKLRARAARQAKEIVRRAEALLKESEKAARQAGTPARISRSELVREQAHLSRLEDAIRPRRTVAPPPDQVAAGERYWVDTLGREVEILRPQDGADRVLVLSAGMRIELPRTALSPPGSGGADAGAPEPDPVRIRVPETDEVEAEVHLIGMRVEEALDRLEYALDRALLAGLKELRVVHGKGTGTLKQAVEEYCRQHRGVASARPAERWEGGAGATVLELEG